SVRPSNGPRSGAAIKTLSWPVYVRSEPKPPKIALGTQLVGTPAWQIVPVRPDLSSAAPLTWPLPISVIPGVAACLRGGQVDTQRLATISVRTASVVLQVRVMRTLLLGFDRGKSLNYTSWRVLSARNPPVKSWLIPPRVSCKLH